MDRLTPPAGARVIWLVTVEGYSLPLRLATSDCEITDSARGVTYRYAGDVLSIDVSEALGAQGEDAGGISVPVSVLLTPTQSAHLALRVAEVAQWVEGTDWSLRRVVMRGAIVSPEWGQDGEPVTFSIECRLWTDPSLYPGPLLVVDGTTWDHVETAAAGVAGSVYPTIIGQPGNVSTTLSTTGRITGSRGLMTWLSPVDRTTTISGVALLVAGHHVSASRVYLSCDASSTTRFIVRNGYDLRGQPVAWVPWYYATAGGTPADEYEYDATFVAGGGSYSNKTSSDTDGDATYSLGSYDTFAAFVDSLQDVYVTWDDDISYGGGMEWRGSTLRNAADVIEWAASQTGIPVDSATFRSIRSALAVYNIDAVIEERVSPWEWVKSNILPMLPLTLTIGPLGVTPILWRVDARPADATLILDADADPRIARTTPIREDTQRIANRITVRYARDIKTGVYRGTVSIGPGPYSTSTPTDYVSAYCRESVSRYRFPNGQPMLVETTIDLPCTCDDATAVAVAETRARMDALASRSVGYTVPVTPYGPSIARGAVARVVDAPAGLSSAVGLVTDVEWSLDGESATVTLWLLPDPSSWGAP